MTALIHLVLVNHARQVLGQLVEALQQRFALMLGGSLLQQAGTPATAQANKIGIGFIKALATWAGAGKVERAKALVANDQRHADIAFQAELAVTGVTAEA